MSSAIKGALFGATLTAMAMGSAAALAQEASPPVSGWRVECGGDGKTLQCVAVQRLVARENNQLVAQLAARLPDPGATPPPAGTPPVPVLIVQVPLGVSASDPILLKVDDGKEEKVPIQTCNSAGCFATLPLRGPFLASLHTGKAVKLAFQDTEKRTFNIDIPLLGFGLAFDKATK
jgi:invasion protein IalB